MTYCFQRMLSWYLKYQAFEIPGLCTVFDKSGQKGIYLDASEFICKMVWLFINALLYLQPWTISRFKSVEFGIYEALLFSVQLVHLQSTADSTAESVPVEIGKLFFPADKSFQFVVSGEWSHLHDEMIKNARCIIIRQLMFKEAIFLVFDWLWYSFNQTLHYLVAGLRLCMECCIMYR